ncbi:MAG: flagellar protein FlaG, partial [Alphaproteobacteria bacterium]
MESLTFSAHPQGNASELRNAKPVTPGNRLTESSVGEAAAPIQPNPEEQRREPVEVKRVEAEESPFQTRLHYDKDKAALFVEILDRATGDVIQRIPAETAAERVHELTGSQGGAVVDK